MSTIDDLDPKSYRVRMAPSPTGSPHVGLVRTALYNWAFARHHGGTFVFRIEDTDKARNTEESYRGILDLMRWLRLDWDEGVEVGGSYGPYRQSERTDIYADVLARLRSGKHVYECYCTADEVTQRYEARLAEYKAKKAAGDKGEAPVQGYDGFCRDLTEAEIEKYEAEGRTSVPRFRMPDGSITWHDLVRGEVTFEARHVPDFALARASGDPLYTLTAPVDDATMRITHVFRGEDLLSSTPRQIALFDALRELGVAEYTPAYGHLPYVMGEGNKKLSKRDPEAHALKYRDEGFLPEGILNYMALLGWAIAADRDIFSMEEMVEAFEISDVVANPARFDLKKCEAINASHMRLLPIEEIQHRVIPFLQRDGVISDPVSSADAELLEAAMPLIAERINKLAEAGELLRFLFIEEADFALDEADAAKLLDAAGIEVVRASYDALQGLGTWSTADIQEALTKALIDGLGLKPRKAYGPVRVAVTGGRVSPPLFESMELLGRDRTLGRLDAALSRG